MIYTDKIQKAIDFAITTHELDQKQKRKGKDVPYITHPLTVGLILARAGANEDLITAGILHDTIEDSIKEKKVTHETLKAEFGENVADLVWSVTEKNKDLPWDERKRAARADLHLFTSDMALLKSADMVSNLTELMRDYKRDGIATFNRFNAASEKVMGHSIEMISAILQRWSDNPLFGDLEALVIALMRIDQITDPAFPQYYLVDIEHPVRLDSDGKEVWATHMYTGKPYSLGKVLKWNCRITRDEAEDYLKEFGGRA